MYTDDGRKLTKTMNPTPLPGELTALPKLGEILDDEDPCIRPLAKNEIQEICERLGVNHEYLERLINFDYDQLAQALSSRSVAKLLLARDVASLESIALAIRVASEIAADPQSDRKTRLLAVKELGKLQKVQAITAEYLMKVAKKVEEEVKK
jgi:hypothetical protein